MSECPYCGTSIPASVQPGTVPELYGCAACFNPVILAWQGGTVTTNQLAHTADIRHISPEGSIGHAILEVLRQGIEHLPVLPEISQHVLKMVHDPDVTMKDLAQVIEQDAAIALAIMRLANSPVYGGLQEIHDLDAACARLGMKAIANTVQLVANGNLFITGDKRLKVFMRKLWRHSIATAHCCSVIGSIGAMPRTEGLFLAGLIHGVGKVVLLDIITGSYSGAIGKLRVTPELLREVIDSFHPLIGLHVAQHWNLPPEYGGVIYCQDDPGMAPNDDWVTMAHVVNLGSAIASVEGYGMYKPENAFLTSHPSARFLNLNDIKLASLRVDLADTLEAFFSAAGASDEA